MGPAGTPRSSALSRALSLRFFSPKKCTSRISRRSRFRNDRERAVLHDSLPAIFFFFFFFLSRRTLVGKPRLRSSRVLR